MTEEVYNACTDKEKVILLEGWLSGARALFEAERDKRLLSMYAGRSFRDNGEYKGLGLNASAEFINKEDPVDMVEAGKWWRSPASQSL